MPPPLTPDRLGTGLRLDRGDLVFDTERRLETVEGRANLTQALALRILTAYGSDPFHATYGLDLQQVFAGPNGPRAAAELVRMNLVRTLGTDPRVAEIRRIQFDGSDTPSQLVRRGRGWPVTVEIVTIDDETLVLNTSVGG